MNVDATVVIPVLNQLSYTQQCIASLVAGGTPAAALLVIDNASTDETPAWLQAHPEIPSVRNRANLGCGGAWTQGALCNESEWTVLLNNDIVMCHAGIARLIGAADAAGLDVASPALIEGPLDYDFNTGAAAFVEKMSGTIRGGWFHGVCFAVRRRVFETVGFPDTDRHLGGREDVEFLIRCLRSKVPVGTVGDAILHHFGSITQKSIKLETGQDDLGDRAHFYTRVGMGWWSRKRFKAAREQQAREWSRAERAKHGLSLHMLRENGGWNHAEYL